jgi:hypothetical protein
MAKGAVYVNGELAGTLEKKKTVPMSLGMRIIISLMKHSFLLA